MTKHYLFILLALAVLNTGCSVAASGAFSKSHKAHAKGDYRQSNSQIERALSAYSYTPEEQAKLMALKASNYRKLGDPIKANATLSYLVETFPRTEAGYSGAKQLQALEQNKASAKPKVTAMPEPKPSLVEVTCPEPKVVEVAVPAPFTADDELHPQLQKLQHLLELSQSAPDALAQSYELLRALLEESGSTAAYIDKPLQQEQPLKFEQLGRTVMVSTYRQYRTQGFLIFFNTNSASLMLEDTSYDLGVGEIDITDVDAHSLQSVVAVSHVTSYGSGLFNEAWRIYAVDNNSPYLALTRPKSEVNSGWGVYEHDIVEYEAQFDLKTGPWGIQLHTSGVARFGDSSMKTLNLPNEVYQWDHNTRSFDQTQGRVTHKRSSMSDIYGDLLGVKGDWFRKPIELESR